MNQWANLSHFPAIIQDDLGNRYDVEPGKLLKLPEGRTAKKVKYPTLTSWKSISN
jgi:hypothetical protein